MTWIIGLITGNPIARFVAKLAGIALAVLTFGAWQRRQGAQGAKAKQAAAQAKAEAQAHERMNDADLGIGASDSERIDRLRDFATKHGNGQTKGKGG